MYRSGGNTRRQHTLECYLADDGEECGRFRRPQAVVSLLVALPPLRRNLAGGGHVIDGGLVPEHVGVGVLEQHFEEEDIGRVGTRRARNNFSGRLRRCAERGGTTKEVAELGQPCKGVGPAAMGRCVGAAQDGDCGHGARGVAALRLSRRRRRPVLLLLLGGRPHQRLAEHACERVDGPADAVDKLGAHFDRLVLHAAARRSTSVPPLLALAVLALVPALALVVLILLVLIPIPLVIARAVPVTGARALTGRPCLRARPPLPSRCDVVAPRPQARARQQASLPAMPQLLGRIVLTSPRHPAGPDALEASASGGRELLGFVPPRAVPRRAVAGIVERHGVARPHPPPARNVEAAHVRAGCGSGAPHPTLLLHLLQSRHRLPPAHAGSPGAAAPEVAAVPGAAVTCATPALHRAVLRA